MANILLKKINQGLHDRIKARAALEHKRIPELVVELLEEGMAVPGDVVV